MHWLPDGIKFKVPFKELIYRFEKSQQDIHTIVEAKSLFELFCDECGNLITSCFRRSHVDLFAHFYNGHYYCTTCLKQAKAVEPRVPIAAESVTQAMKTAIDRESWKLLDYATLEVLLVIALARSKEEVNHILFSNKTPEMTSAMWNRHLNWLERLNLIEVKRYSDRTVKQYVIHGALKQMLVALFPQYFNEPIYELDETIQPLIEKVANALSMLRHIQPLHLPLPPPPS